MTHAERVRIALAGGRAEDRAPFAFWFATRGMPSFRSDAWLRTVLEQWHQFQPDVLKVPAPDEEETSDPAAVTADYVTALRRLREYLPADDPPVVLATVPGALNAMDSENAGRTGERLRDAPQATYTRLKELAGRAVERSRTFVTEGGADGIFVVLHLPRPEQIAPERYKDAFGARELEVVKAAAQAGWCNVAHLHGGPWPESAMRPFIEAASVISWSDQAAGPTLEAMREQTAACFMAGLNERQFAGYTPEQAKDETREALTQTTGGNGLIVAPGCSLPRETPPANLEAVIAELDNNA